MLTEEFKNSSCSGDVRSRALPRTRGSAIGSWLGVMLVLVGHWPMGLTRPPRPTPLQYDAVSLWPAVDHAGAIVSRSLLRGIYRRRRKQARIHPAASPLPRYGPSLPQQERTARQNHFSSAAGYCRTCGDDPRSAGGRAPNAHRGARAGAQGGC